MMVYRWCCWASTEIHSWCSHISKKESSQRIFCSFYVGRLPEPY